MESGFPHSPGPENEQKLDFSIWHPLPVQNVLNVLACLRLSITAVQGIYYFIEGKHKAQEGPNGVLKPRLYAAEPDPSLSLAMQSPEQRWRCVARAGKSIISIMATSQSCLYVHTAASWLCHSLSWPQGPCPSNRKMRQRL